MKINNVDEALKSMKKIYLLSLSENETCINDYNPLLLLLWKANMDNQFIAEQSLALAHYVTGSITKPERRCMQDIWNELLHQRAFMVGSLALGSKVCVLRSVVFMR